MNRKWLGPVIIVIGIALLIILATGCGGDISQPTTTLSPVTTVTETPITLPSIPTTVATMPMMDSDLAAEKAWLQETAKPMAGFVWMLTNFSTVVDGLGPDAVEQAMVNQVTQVDSIPAPTARTQEIATGFKRVVAPLWMAIKSLNAGDMAKYQEAMGVIQSQTYQDETKSFAYNFGTLAQECGMAEQVMDWMQNGVS